MLRMSSGIAAVEQDGMRSVMQSDSKCFPLDPYVIMSANRSRDPGQIIR